MQVNFGRGIRIIYDRNAFGKDKQNNNVSDIFKTMTEGDSSAFDRETSRKIGQFLQAQFHDYKKTSGIYFWQSKKGLYAFTGEEFQAARKIKSNEDKEMTRLNKRMSSKKGGSEIIKRDKRIAEIQKRREEALEKLAENGRNRKPDSSITIKTAKDGKLKELQYYSFERTKEGGSAACEILTI